MDKHYLMVRAMLSEEDDFKVFLENNVVAVGWSSIDFTQYANISDLRNAVQKKYYSKHSTSHTRMGINLNEVERFKEIQPGDYIIVPYYSSILLAIAEEEEIYSKNDFDRDLSNQRRVSYKYINNNLLQISRNDLSEGLQRRLRVRGMTVSNLYEFKDEIELLFTTQSYSFTSAMQAKEQKELLGLKTELLKNIQSGKTNLSTGGIGLEHLVCELMQCEGYDAKVLPKTYFSGKADADIQAIKDDAFSSTKIFVQVKHHSNYSNSDGVQQIIDVLKQDKYSDYTGIFLTSAAVDDSVRKIASNNGIDVIDGEGLVDLIVNNIPRLSTATIRLLGLSPYPHII